MKNVKKTHYYIKNLIAGITALVLVTAVSANFLIDKQLLTVEASNSVPGYDSTDVYVADSLINGLIDLSTGESSDMASIYDMARERTYTYETLAEAVMEDQGLLVSSAFWTLANGIIDGDLSKVSQQEIYEVFLIDYLTSDMESYSIDVKIYNEETKYLQKIYKDLLKSGIADSEEELKKLINSSDSLTDSKVVEALEQYGYLIKLKIIRVSVAQ